MDRWIRPVIPALLGLSLATFACEARAGESYYVLVFGSETRPKLLRYTHTWAVFIRAVGEGPDPNNYALELHTISWLPRTLRIRVFRPYPEPGVNLGLYETLDVVGRDREHVTMWGPFDVRKEYFERAIEIERLLESGQEQYRAIDGSLDMEVSDCIHAVAAVDPVFGRRHYPLIRIGEPASRYIARQYMTRAGFDQWQGRNAWLIPRLGLDRYPIEVVPPQRIPKRSCFLCRCPE